jgi:radical SAM protein with 4Fe4S-binding SPASM domain
MRKRVLHLIKNRIKNLPVGPDLLTYSVNQIKLYFAHRNKKLFLPHPNSLILEVTNHCQLKCITCAREYEFGKNMDRGHMDIKAAQKFVRENHIFLDKIGLTGLGEPLIYPHLDELIKYIRTLNNGISIFISTNAQLARTPEIIDNLADDVDTLQISIDGIGEVFEKIRKGANFGSYLKNLEAISQISVGRRLDIKLNMVVLKENYLQLKEIVSLARDLNIPEIYLNTMNLVATDWDLAYYGFYSSEKLKKELQEVISIARQNKVHIIYPKFSSDPAFSSCPYPWNHFYVSWDGFLVPCCAKPFPKEKNFGNVFQTDLMSCINHTDFLKFREMSKQNITPDFCKRCHYTN